MNPERIARGAWQRYCEENGLDPGLYRVRLMAQKRERRRAHAVILAEGPARYVIKSVALPARGADTTGIVATMEQARERGAWMPRIFAAFPDERSIVMEHVEGRNAARLAASDPSGAIGHAGRWLGDFHKAGPVTLRRFAPHFMQDHLARLADQAEAGTRRIIRLRRFRDCLAALEPYAAEARNAEARSSISHGDFHIGNLIMTPQGEPVGIDPAPWKTAPVAYDICRFLADMAVRHTQPLPDQMAQFLAAYGEDGTDPSVYDFVIRARLLADWAALTNSPWSLPKMRRGFRILRLAQRMAGNGPAPEPERGALLDGAVRP